MVEPDVDITPHLVRRVLAPEKAVEIAGDDDADRSWSRYVPAIDRARQELGLSVWTPLEEAIRRTGAWVRERA